MIVEPLTTSLLAVAPLYTPRKKLGDPTQSKSNETMKCEMTKRKINCRFWKEEEEEEAKMRENGSNVCVGVWRCAWVSVLFNVLSTDHIKVEIESDIFQFGGVERLHISCRTQESCIWL
jgi:hypothetical protein